MLVYLRVGLGLTSGYSNESGLLPTVWNSSRGMIRRHAVAIFIRHEENGSSALVPPKVKFGQKLGGYYTHDGFYMHQVPLAFMAVFRQASLPVPGAEDSTDWATMTLYTKASTC